MKRRDGFVYSTQFGHLCPTCQNPVAPPPPQSGSAPSSDGIVRVGRQTKGRKGKGVTTVDGAPLDASGLKALCKELKQKCGSGGALKDHVIEIQGDHRDAIVALLEAKGWTVKRSGG